MSSILRSSKFVRYFVGLARNIVLSTSREVDGSLVQRSQCLASAVSNNYATVAAQNQSTALDKSIKRLDEDARRIGRISRKEIEEVLDEIRQSKKATSSQSLMVIRCCGNLVPEEAPELRTQLVKQVWNTLENLGVPMDISHYNALLRVYLENEHRFSPTQFLTDLEAKGVEPNRVTYHRLVAGFCQEGDIAGATRILEFMREKQLPVSENVFNALILGHSQADDLESAHGILGVMRQAGLEPSNETYTTLLCGYAKKGDIAALEKLMEECEAKDIFLTDKDVLEIIYTSAVNKHTELVDKILPKVKHLLGYNQDAANVILRLINKGDDETALKIFKTMHIPTRSNGQPIYAGSFMIKQMVKANMPIERIVSVCKELRDQGLNTLSFPIAVQATFTINNVKQTLDLIQALADNKDPVRIHYFWPVLISASKSDDKEEVKTIISTMINEYNLPPNQETMKLYILPFLSDQTPDAMMKVLHDAGVKRGTSAAAVIGHLVTQNKLAEAARLALQNVDINFQQSVSIISLVLAYQTTQDLNSFVTLTRGLVNSVDKNRAFLAQNIDEDEVEGEAVGNSNLEKEEVVGRIVLELASRNNPNLAQVLVAFIDHGLAISNSCAQLVENSLSGKNLTEEVSTLLAKLASGEMASEPLRREMASGVKAQISKNPHALISLKEKLIARGESIDGVLRQLFTLYCWNKETDDAMRIKTEMESKNLEITSAQYAQLLDAFLNKNQLTEAVQIYEEVKSKEPEFTLDKVKTLKMANLFLQNDNIEESIEFLKSNAKSGDKEANYIINSYCWRMLNSLAEKKDVENVKKMLAGLAENNYVDISNVLLGPIIKAHLLNDDLLGALDEFERCCELHRATPWKNELMCKLIQVEDATNLQRLTDLSTQIHGEVNSLYDLVLAFVECGRIRQARKILETPGLRAREDRINMACQRYKNDGLVAPLENLVEVTKDIGHIDRTSIYYQLLLSYKKSNEVEKALGLWTKMQEEDVPVSEEFLVTLGNFLKANGKEPPFAISASTSSQASKSVAESKTETQMKPVLNKARSVYKDKFISALQNNQVDKALEAKDVLEGNGEILNRTDRSRLLEVVLKEDRINEANRLVLSWLPDKPPSGSVLSFYATKLSLSGDLETFDQFGSFLSEAMLKRISYENKRVNCLMVNGKGKEELERWEKAIDSATTQDEIDDVCTRFPRGGMQGILEQHPECIPDFERMMEKYNNKGYIAPANNLFSYYFSNFQLDEAKAVYNKYLTNTSRLMFQSILAKARSTRNPELVEQLKNLIENSPSSTPGVMGHLYSTIITINCFEEKYDEALSKLEEALKVCSLENINKTALEKLKTGLEVNKKTFKYTIPLKNAVKSKDKSSSSSSSSDDEKKPAQIKQSL